jgi:hypothetical protein
MGGEENEGGFGVAVDSDQNVYTVGFFRDTADFDPGDGLFNLTSTSSNRDDIFISKLDSDGNFVWAQSMGGLGGDVAYSVAVDGNDDIYVSGEFLQTASFGDFTLGPAFLRDAFVCKISSDGAILWAKQLVGVRQDNGGHDSAWSMALGDDGNVYVAGDFIGIASFDSFTLTSAGNKYDIFVAKLDGSNGNIVWARQMGGMDVDRGFDVAVDGSGNVYAVGFFTGTAYFDIVDSTYDSPLTSWGPSDVFVSKFDSDGHFVWARQMGGNIGDNAYGVAVDDDGNVYTTGYTDAGSYDPWVFKLDSDGNLVWDRRIIGPAPSWGSGVAVDDSGGIYITGHFGAWIGFDTTPPNCEDPNDYDEYSCLWSQGSSDIFVSKFDSDGYFVWARQMGGEGKDLGLDVAVDGSGKIYTTGSFSGIAYFGPDEDNSLTSNGLQDIFVSKFGGSGPVTSNVEANPYPVPIDASSVVLTATVDDTDTGGSYIRSARYEIRDIFANLVVVSGEMSAIDGAFEDEVTEYVAAELEVNLVESGVYEACVQGTDELGNVGDFACILVPVYDPDGGSVTGGGWIYSEPGSCSLTPACESAEGKANFGFVSEYKKGAHTPAGNLNFHSYSYDWLVVAGARAQYRGSGTINGGGAYSFLLTAVDGDITGGKTDRFRIMIWGDSGLVYDNKRGEDPIDGKTTELGGGNIAIHKK